MQINPTQHAAQNWTADKSQSECCTNKAEVFGALFRRSDIGEIGIGDGIACAGNAPEQARNQHHQQRRRDRDQEIMQSQSDDRRDQHEAATQPVADGAQHWCTEKLHQTECHRQAHIPPGLHFAAFGICTDQNR